MSTFKNAYMCRHVYANSYDKRYLKHAQREISSNSRKRTWSTYLLCVTELVKHHTYEN